MKSLLFTAIALFFMHSAVGQTNTANDDLFNVSADSVLSVVAPGLLDNDEIMLSDSFAVVLMDQASNGTVLLGADGSFTYQPDQGFSGTDSFTYFIETIPSTVQALVVDSSNSSMNIDMTVTFLFSSRQDAATGRITGGSFVMTDTNEAPFSTAQILELDVEIVDSLSLDFDFDGGNNVFATADTNAFTLTLLEPGPMGAVTDGTFEQTDNVVNLSGIAEIIGTGLFADIIDDAIPDSLLIFDVQDTVAVSSTISQMDDLITLQSTINISDDILLDESGLASATIDVTGILVGTGNVKRPVQSNVATVSITVDPPASNTSTDLEVPFEYALHQNYPNPFNPSTSISFAIASADYVSLIVYDTLGREVRTLVDNAMAPGTHQVQFDAASLPSGVYMYRLVSGDYSATRTLMLVK